MAKAAANRKQVIDQARQEVHNAEDHLTKLVKANYPLNSVVTVTRGRGSVLCMVVMHGSRDERIKVRNLSNEKEYWIRAYDMAN